MKIEFETTVQDHRFPVQRFFNIYSVLMLSGKDLINVIGSKACTTIPMTTVSMMDDTITAENNITKLIKLINGMPASMHKDLTLVKLVGGTSVGAYVIDRGFGSIPKACRQRHFNRIIFCWK